MSRKPNDPGHPTGAQTFGGNLREARHRKGLTQGELADRSGVDRSAISNYEHAVRQPNLSTIVKLAGALEAPPGALVHGL